MGTKGYVYLDTWKYTHTQLFTAHFPSVCVCKDFKNTLGLLQLHCLRTLHCALHSRSHLKGHELTPRKPQAAGVSRGHGVDEHCPTERDSGPGGQQRSVVGIQLHQHPAEPFEKPNADTEELSPGHVSSTEGRLSAEMYGRGTSGHRMSLPR